MQGTKRTESYTYDAVGNRTYQPGVPYTYNSSNEMLTREGVPYTYDANGNLLSKTNGSSTTSYAWDLENRLTSVTLPTGSVVSLTYDPFGRRIRKASAAGTTVYVYDGSNIEEELNASGGVVERYTYGPGVYEPLVGQRQPKIFFYEADGLGSVTSLTDPTGAVAATYTYDSFGFLTSSTGSATNWFRYTARQFDSDTALYYYRARYYDPTIGRFISEDPIRFYGGINFYVYAASNPASKTDPLGLQSMDQFLGALQTKVPGTSTYNVGGGTYYIVFPAGMTYGQVINALENAGYYDGPLAWDPLFHPSGQEFRTCDKGPGFHFKVAYPDQMPVPCPTCRGGIGSQDVPGPVVGTDVHIDNPNPIPLGWNTLGHAGDFFKGIWNQLWGK